MKLGDTMENKLTIMAVSGTLYEKGFQLGERFQHTIQTIVEDTRELLKQEDIHDRFLIVKRKLEERYADILDEVYGRADGAKVDRDEYLLYLCPEIYTYHDSCTDIIIKDMNGNIVGGHNEDGNYHLENSGLVKYRTEYGYLCDFFTTDTLAGGNFCWNSHGMIFTGNSIYVKHMNHIGIPNWFILRRLVDAKSIEAVLQLFDCEDAASGFNLNVVDTNQKRAISIEYRLNIHSTIEINDKFAHSNHFTSEEVGLPLTNKGSNSKFRLDKSLEFLKKYSLSYRRIDERDILNILQYRGKNYADSILDTQYPKMTAATFVYNSKRQIVIYCYLDHYKYHVSFDMENLLSSDRESNMELFSI